MVAIMRFPPGARVRPGDLGDGVVRAAYRFQVSPLPLPSQAQADQCADTPELRRVCVPQTLNPGQGGAARNPDEAGWAVVTHEQICE